MFKKHMVFLTLSIAATPIHPLKHSILVPVSLRPPFQKAQSVLIGHFPQAWAGTAHQLKTQTVFAY